MGIGLDEQRGERYFQSLAEIDQFVRGQLPIPGLDLRDRVAMPAETLSELALRQPCAGSFGAHGFQQGCVEGAAHRRTMHIIQGAAFTFCAPYTHMIESCTENRTP
jgi:hypothetical protein